MREDKMTRQERMEALFSYRKPDRVPIGTIATGFCTVSGGHTVADAYVSPETAFRDKLWTQDMYRWERIPFDFHMTVVAAWDFGGEMKFPDPESRYSGSLMVKRTPVQTEEDVWNLKLPDYKTAGKIAKATEHARLVQKHGIPVTFFGRSPFTYAADMCGVDRFLKWMMRKPEICHRAIQVGMEHILNVLKYWVDTFGAENMVCFMSTPSESNQLISPKQFETFALPYHVEIHKKIRELGVRRFLIHICGEQNLNLPLLSEASPWPHPAILSFGHEVDLETAARHFPKDIIFGNIEPAVIQEGTPQQVYELCRKAIEKGKRLEGGFMLGTGCELPVYSPPINVYAMTKAVYDLGWYG